MFATGKMWLMSSKSYKKSFLTRLKKLLESFFCCITSKAPVWWFNVQLSEILHSLFHIQCSAKHPNFQLILQSVFNCCAKNQLKRINSQPNVPDRPSKAMRCIKKLTGKSSSNQ